MDFGAVGVMGGFGAVEGGAGAEELAVFYGGDFFEDYAQGGADVVGLEDGF